MSKEHLETDLTIKASYKVVHILELTHLQIAPFFMTSKWNTYICMREIDQESKSANNLKSSRSWNMFGKILVFCFKKNDALEMRQVLPSTVSFR